LKPFFWKDDFMSVSYSKLGLTLLFMSATALSTTAEARKLGTLDFHACSLPVPQTSITVSAQCATLKVAENPAQPKGRQIELALAWIPAKGEAEADPVFMIAGGPGQSALESYPSLHPVFNDVIKKRNIILVDQRGTGKSNPLICKDAAGKSAVGENEAIAKLDLGKARLFAKNCAEELSKRADTRFYSTGFAIGDLDLVRAKIGADKINIYGVSYGTRVAQQYAMHYPQHTRTVVLDGVVPNSLILGAEHAINLEAALNLYFARCTADKICRERFGNPREKLDTLRTQLLKAPMTVNYNDPMSGEAKQDKLDIGSMATVARMYAYSPLTASMLPLLLTQASQGNAGPLLAQAQMMNQSLGDAIMHGMQLSVICGEDAAELKADPASENTIIGNSMIGFLKAQCEVWPYSKRAADFREPLKGNVPVLLLSGEFDPVTPPRYGAAVAKYLPNSRHIIVKGQGHNVLPVGCVPKIFARFIDSADAKNLDAKCLDSLAYVPPFIGFYGWEP
jgi:pimeloyl-ACP methyl ester carboxylesterase